MSPDNAFGLAVAMLLGLLVVGFWFHMAEKRIITEIRKSREPLPAPPSEEGK